MLQASINIPRWLAALLIFVGLAAQVTGTVAAAVSIAANLKYLRESNGGSAHPPPPYSGQPVMQGEPENPEKPAKGKEDKTGRKIVRPRGR